MMPDHAEWIGYINGLTSAMNMRPRFAYGDDGGRVINDLRDQIAAKIADIRLMQVFQDGQPIGPIRPSLKRDMIFSVEDSSLSDAEFREAVRRAVRNPWYV